MVCSLKKYNWHRFIFKHNFDYQHSHRTEMKKLPDYRVFSNCVSFTENNSIIKWYIIDYVWIAVIKVVLSSRKKISAQITGKNSRSFFFTVSRFDFQFFKFYSFSLLMKRKQNRLSNIKKMERSQNTWWKSYSENEINYEISQRNRNCTYWTSWLKMG